MNSKVNNALANRAKVEIFIQATRIMKSMVRSGNVENAHDFVNVLNINGGIQLWETNLDDIRSKRLFKKSVSILRNLMGEFTIREILAEPDVKYIRDIASLEHLCRG